MQNVLAPYEPCKVEIIPLCENDVITTSPIIDDDPNQGPWI